MKIAVVGGGISGVSVARMLHSSAEVVLFEKADKIGGLISCEETPAGLYHKLGGHVFNTKSRAVSDWFWNHFDRDNEFSFLTRNAKILINDALVSYPIENHLYQLPQETCGKIVTELLLRDNRDASSAAASNLSDYFLRTFGKTLCETYFFPYNEKIWRCDLKEIALEWLEGKLPMPQLSEIISANILRQEESAMVHARFFYPKNGGSQFVIDRLAAGLNSRCGQQIDALRQGVSGEWYINGTNEPFDHVIYSGDVRKLSGVIGEPMPVTTPEAISTLRTRGITNVFCECDETDVSWLYLPGREFSANRIIYTGGFSRNNNRGARMTCVVEFLHGEDMDRIQHDLARLPGRLTMRAMNHVRDAYIIPQSDTRGQIQSIRDHLGRRNLHLLGRFAEWEYFNIDKCIESAMRVRNSILSPSTANQEMKVA